MAEVQLTLETRAETVTEKRAAERSGGWPRTGAVLIGLSVALWVLLPLVTVLPISMEARAALGGAMLVGAELAFWAGAVLAGPRVVKGLRGWFRERLRVRRVRGSK